MPLEISDTSNENSQDSDVMITRLPIFLRGNEIQNTEVSQNASVQTIEASERSTRTLGDTSETSESDNQTPNPFEMSLTAYVRSRNNALSRSVTTDGPSLQQFEQIIGSDPDSPALDVQMRNNLLRAIFEENVGQQSESRSSEQPTGQTAEPQANNSSEQSNTERREPEAEQDTERQTESQPLASAESANNRAETNNAGVAHANVGIGKYFSFIYGLLTFNCQSL